MRIFIVALLVSLIGSSSFFYQSLQIEKDLSEHVEIISSDEVRYLNLPARPPNAMSGSEFALHTSSMSLINREKALVREILSGNVPFFSRTLRPVIIKRTINTESYELLLFTTCDYMAIGSDLDYLYIPMTPSTAQYLADEMKCTLPTKKLVDNIYNPSEIKLYPQPIPPSDKMTTIPVFMDHTDSIKKQFNEREIVRSADKIVAGHKKDIIISNKIYSSDRNYDRVVIYGWHLGIDDPIQPVYNGHSASYADYSHGVRLISDTLIINGGQYLFKNIVSDPDLSVMVSSEGKITKPFYPDSDIFTSMDNEFPDLENDFKLNQNFPNPFNPSTIITYRIPQNGFTNLKLYNIQGEEVAHLINEMQSPGNYSLVFNAEGLPSGTYFYTLESGHFSKTRKFLILK
jgi:hypothetical protein